VSAKAYLRRDALPQLDGISEAAQIAPLQASLTSVEMVPQPVKVKPQLSPFSKAIKSAPHRRSKVKVRKIYRPKKVEISDSDGDTTSELSEHESDFVTDVEEPVVEPQSQPRIVSAVQPQTQTRTPSSRSVSLGRTESMPRADSSFTEESVEELSVSKIETTTGKRISDSVFRGASRRLFISTPSKVGDKSRLGIRESSSGRNSRGPMKRPKALILEDDESEDELAL
jgi:hypothetical protein